MPGSTACGLNLAQGDAILFAGADLVQDGWDVRLLTDVDVDPDGGRTYVRWEKGLGSYSPPADPAVAPAVFVLRKRLAVFGHNAPVWRAMNDTFRAGYQAAVGVTGGPECAAVAQFRFGQGRWRRQHRRRPRRAHSPTSSRGSWVVLSQDGPGFHRELYKVVQRAELSRAGFAISGKVTRLTLRGDGVRLRDAA